MSKTSFVLFSILCASLQAQSRSVPQIGDQEARAHLLHGVDPLYFPLAVANEVSGEVILDVNVNADGKETKMTLVSGPEMMAQATGEAVRGWQFSPFLIDGKPAAVTVELKFNFPILKLRPESVLDEKVARVFFKKRHGCLDDVWAKDWAEATERCEKTLTIADQFPEKSVRARDIERVYLLYGRAFVGIGQPGNALIQFQTAATMARTYFLPWTAEYAMPFYLCAATEALMGQNDTADSYYSYAESSYRAAIAKSPPARKEHIEQALAIVLLRHASLADKAGKTSEAVELRHQAANADRKAKLKNAADFPNLSVGDIF